MARSLLRNGTPLTLVHRVGRRDVNKVKGFVHTQQNKLVCLSPENTQIRLFRGNLGCSAAQKYKTVVFVGNKHSIALNDSIAYPTQDKWP